MNSSDTQTRVQAATPPVPAPGQQRPDSVTDLDPMAWEQAVADMPGRTVFHRLPWLRAVERRFGVSIRLLAAGDPEAPTLIWPWLTQRKGPLTVAGSPLPGWGTAYLGPLAHPRATPSEVEVAVRATLAHPAIRRASYLETRIVRTDQPDIFLEDHGYRALRQFTTLILDLDKPEDELWSGLDRRCRNAVRRGEKQGYEVRLEQDAHWVEPFYAMAVEVFANWQLSPPFDVRFLQILHEELSAAGQLQVWSAWLDGKREATSVFLTDDRRIYYWGAASYDTAKKRSPNNVLVWRVIQAAAEQSFEHLDFVSASGSAGRFKKTFGPRGVPICQHYGRSRTRIEGWLKRAYERYARWRR